MPRQLQKKIQRLPRLRSPPPKPAKNHGGTNSRNAKRHPQPRQEIRQNGRPLQIRNLKINKSFVERSIEE